MDTKSFTSLLRKIIREEVRSAVREEMKTLLNERKTDHKQVIQHGSRLHQMTEKNPYDITFSAKSAKPTKPKQFVKDSMLNDLLNETALSSAEIEQEWPTMNFQSEMAQAYGSGQTAVAPPTDFDHRPVNMDNPAVVATVDAMTRDYSALMKAIDKKKGIK
jgi:hypothetical protein